MESELLTYSVFGRTDKGPVRETNEDFLLIDKDQNLFAIADGLGGLPMGDLASETAITSLAAISYDSKFNFQVVFNKINETVNALGETINTDFGIATTLTAIKLQDNILFGGHVGDTGVFLFKKSSYIKLTKDDTMAEQMMEEGGEDIYIPSYYYHILTQCIGKGNEPNIQTFEHVLERGDRILLYSDGITLTISPEELHYMAFKAETPEIFVNAIIEEANVREVSDNVTAIAIFVQ